MKSEEWDFNARAIGLSYAPSNHRLVHVVNAGLEASYASWNGLAFVPSDLRICTIILNSNYSTASTVQAQVTYNDTGYSMPQAHHSRAFSSA